MPDLNEYVIFIVFWALLDICSGQRGMWQSAKGSYEYYISPGHTAGTYLEGVSYCEKEGGELAFIKTKRTQDFITKLILECKGDAFGFYIGLRDVDNNGTYQWNDGSPLRYANWNDGQPNVVGVQTCVTMGSRQLDDQLRWHDFYCADGGMGFICQRKKCRKGWIRKEKYKKGENPCFDDSGFKLDGASFMVGFTVPFLLLVIVILIFVMYYRRVERDKQERAKQVEVKQEPIYDVVAADYHIEDDKST